MVRLLHPENASYPISDTLDGTTALVREEQSQKANQPILVTVEGILTEVIVLFLKASSPIFSARESLAILSSHRQNLP